MNRGRRYIREEKGRIFKRTFYYALAIFAVFLVTFLITFIVYKSKIKKSISNSLQTKEISDLVPNYSEYNNDYESKSANKDIGKTIENVIKETENKLNNNDNNLISAQNNSNTNISNDIYKNNNETIENSIETNNNIDNSKSTEKDPEFIIPVEGDIIREFSKDKLIYSNTLDEWIVHLGIDIKAQRTQVVNASESGKITSIKNDPRYGLTVIIEHANGFKTVYSNLLSTEFVKEGESVQKGDAIGTVGNSAAFEISDEPHLHFEILKDNVNVDPRQYI